MKLFGYVIEKENKMSDDDRINEIRKILFPEIKTHTDNQGNKFHIDYSVDSNLMAALMDLEDDFNDETCRNTIKGVLDQLEKVRNILGFQQKLEDEAQYILVDDRKNLEIDKN